MSNYRAPVHFNADSTLMVIPNLVEKTFGIQRPRKRTNWIGTCLVAQVSFTISAIIGLKPMIISRHILQNIGRSAGEDGFTIEEILETFDSPIQTRSGSIRLKLGLSAYDGIDSMAEAILFGHPVLMIIPREVSVLLENEGNTYGDGCSYATPIRPASEGQYHSYLGIGYEVKSDKYPTDFIILRDTRDLYAYKGYMKLGVNVLHQGWNFIRALSVDVLNVER